MSETPGPRFFGAAPPAGATAPTEAPPAEPQLDTGDRTELYKIPVGPSSWRAEMITERVNAAGVTVLRTSWYADPGHATEEAAVRQLLDRCLRGQDES